MVINYWFKARVWLLMLGFAFITCCAPPLTKKEKKLFEEPIANLKNQSLSNLGIMLEIYDYPKTVIQGKNIVNKTACRKNLPFDITDMLKTAVNEIGDKIQYVVYDENYEYYKYGDQFKYHGYGITQGSLPEVVIDGAITECDEDIDSKSNQINAYGMVGGGTTETDLEGSYEKSLNRSRLAIDLHLINFKTNELLPKKQTKMSVDIWSLEKSASFGFMIAGSGLGIDGRRRLVQGKHSAVRSLVELSVLKLIGRYLEIPYWRCLPDGHQDPVVTTSWKKYFRKQVQRNKIKIIQMYLIKCGYKSVKINGNMDQKTQNALMQFTGVNSIRDVPPINADIFVNLMLAVPMPFEKKTTNPYQMLPKIYERTNTYPATKAISFSQLGYYYRPKGKGQLLPINHNTVLTSGDHYKIVFRTDQDCYVHIFQLDSSKQIFQLFPMDAFKGVAVNQSNPVKGGRTYTLPADDKAFVLDNMTGAERIYLIASRNPNHKAEKLYADIKSGLKSDRALMRFLSTKRGLARIATDQKATIRWKETDDIFTVMNQRLENMDEDSVHILSFKHQ